jgi:YesN/AraC family two-component response regulator
VKKKEEIALVISDVVMPEMNGIKMIQEMRKIVPTVKTIVCSGDVPPKLLKDLENLKVDFFSKPFSKDDLLKKVKILTGENSASL